MDTLTIEDLERLTGCTVDRSSLPKETALPVTKEFLLQEIAALERQREKSFADYHAAGGAIQVMRQLLAMVEPDDEQDAG